MPPTRQASVIRSFVDSDKSAVATRILVATSVAARGIDTALCDAAQVGMCSDGFTLLQKVFVLLLKV